MSTCYRWIANFCCLAPGPLSVQRAACITFELIAMKFGKLEKIRGQAPATMEAQSKAGMVRRTVFRCTYCVYPRRDDQVELIYIMWLVTCLYRRSAIPALTIGWIRGVTAAPQTPQCEGPKRSRGPFAAGERNCNTFLGRTSADHLILIHQVKQSDVNRRNAT